MTDRINALIVTLEENIREDDIESTVNAIGHIKGVLTVEKNVADITSHVERSRLQLEYFTKISDVIFPPK